MKLSVLATVAGLVAYALAAPAPAPYVVHEKRERGLDQWTRRDLKLNRDALIPLSIGLVQRNLDSGYSYLMDISHPQSSNYGKHWSFDKVSFHMSVLGSRADQYRLKKRSSLQTPRSWQSKLGLSRMESNRKEFGCPTVLLG